MMSRAVVISSAPCCTGSWGPVLTAQSRPPHGSSQGLDVPRGRGPAPISSGVIFTARRRPELLRIQNLGKDVSRAGRPVQRLVEAAFDLPTLPRAHELPPRDHGSEDGELSAA